MKITIKILSSFLLFVLFIALSFGSGDSSSSKSSGSGGSSRSSSKHTCRYCGTSFSGRGYTTAMRVVNRVDDENSPLNSYCSYKCAEDCILTECFAR
mgnify:CR=1 FL=1